MTSQITSVMDKQTDEHNGLHSSRVVRIVCQKYWQFCARRIAEFWHP